MLIKVFAYRNLHRQCWSVKALEGPLKGKVIYHASDITLAWCDFKVSKAGRQRVLREQKKNVHAGVQGYMSDYDSIPYVNGVAWRTLTMTFLLPTILTSTTALSMPVVSYPFHLLRSLT